MSLKIEWKEWGATKKQDLETILSNNSFDYEGNDFDEVVRKINDLTKFNIKTIELLYEKGILNDKDIISLFKEYLIIEDNTKPIIVK